MFPTTKIAEQTQADIRTRIRLEAEYSDQLTTEEHKRLREYQATAAARLATERQNLIELLRVNADYYNQRLRMVQKGSEAEKKLLDNRRRTETRLRADLAQLTATEQSILNPKVASQTGKKLAGIFSDLAGTITRLTGLPVSGMLGMAGIYYIIDQMMAANARIRQVSLQLAQIEGLAGRMPGITTSIIGERASAIFAEATQFAREYQLPREEVLKRAGELIREAAFPRSEIISIQERALGLGLETGLGMDFVLQQFKKLFTQLSVPIDDLSVTFLNLDRTARKLHVPIGKYIEDTIKLSHSLKLFGVDLDSARWLTYLFADELKDQTMSIEQIARMITGVEALPMGIQGFLMQQMMPALGLRPGEISAPAMIQLFRDLGRMTAEEGRRRGFAPTAEEIALAGKEAKEWGAIRRLRLIDIVARDIVARQMGPMPEDLTEQQQYYWALEKEFLTKYYERMFGILDQDEVIADKQLAAIDKLHNAATLLMEYAKVSREDVDDATKKGLEIQEGSKRITRSFTQQMEIMWEAFMAHLKFLWDRGKALEMLPQTRELVADLRRVFQQYETVPMEVYRGAELYAQQRLGVFGLSQLAYPVLRQALEGRPVEGLRRLSGFGTAAGILPPPTPTSRFYEMERPLFFAPWAQTLPEDKIVINFEKGTFEVVVQEDVMTQIDRAWANQIRPKIKQEIANTLYERQLTRP